MGISKTKGFSEEQLEFSRFAKALGHPARVAILEHLANSSACICGDLVDVLPLAQSTVSQHLKELKAVGLIQGEIEGNKLCYCLNQENWRKLKSYIDKMQSADKSSCC
jgi:ArsR family transcriptional regulator